MMKYSLTLLFFLFSTMLFSQEKKNPPKMTKKMDSLFAVFKKQYLQQTVKNQKRNNSLLKNSPSDSLITLNLSHSNYDKVPDISRFNRVKSIDLTHNRIITINRKNLQSDSLHTLLLTGNRIRHLHFYRNNRITTLTLNNNHLKRIPRSIRRLKHLKTLDLGKNRIKRIPHFILKLDSLNEISLNYNIIRFNKRAVKRLRKINRILLGSNNISQLPENINELKGVHRLNLGKNALSTLPDSFKQLTQLQSLILYKNNFSTIPNVVFSLKNLVELDFYYNRLQSVPEGIGNLTRLKQLFLSYNQIATLPDTLQSLIKLKYFYIHHNQLKIIPVWFLQLQNLERVGLDHNKLFSIPDLSLLPKLKEVDLGFNNLEYLPLKLIGRNDMQLIILRNNPFIMTKEERQALQMLSKQRATEGKSLIF